MSDAITTRPGRRRLAPNRAAEGLPAPAVVVLQELFG